jgi:internalin A
VRRKAGVARELRVLIRVQGKGIDELELLEKYPHLQDVDVGENRLQDLSALAYLPYLTRLDASHNFLTEALDFATRKCDEWQSWNTGDKWVGSALREANLAHNRIQTIRDLYWHRYLSVLDLSHNALLKISGFEGLKYLRSLDLSHNRIAVVEGLNALPLTDLRLANNDIARIEGLDKLPSLERLSLANNRITSLRGLARQAKLKVRDPVEGCDVVMMLMAHSRGRCTRRELISGTQGYPDPA